MRQSRPGNFTDITTAVQDFLRLTQPTCEFCPRAVVRAAKRRSHLIAFGIGFRENGRRLVFPEVQTGFSNAANKEVDSIRRLREEESEGFAPDGSADMK
jgi:hypothetical protein